MGHPRGGGLGPKIVVLSGVMFLKVLGKKQKMPIGELPDGSIQVVRAHVGSLFHGEKIAGNFGLSLLYSVIGQPAGSGPGVRSWASGGGLGPKNRDFFRGCVFEGFRQKTKNAHRGNHQRDQSKSLEPMLEVFLVVKQLRELLGLAFYIV